jgi:hypothetical protein
MGVPNQAHDTIIQNLPNYVALNQDDDEYLIFEQMPRLYKNLYYNLDDQEHSMFSKESPSCLMALFHDQPSQITKFLKAFCSHSRQYQLCGMSVQIWFSSKTLKVINFSLRLPSPWSCRPIAQPA